MIKRLRKKFICIAMISVAAVMLLLCVIVNTANLISVDSGLREMLTTISENKGKLPKKPFPKPDGRPQFNPETPFSTRYFALFYDSDGTLTLSDLSNIAAVTEENVDEYLSVATNHENGFGYYKGYRYLITENGEGRYMAVFLDCQKERGVVIKLAVLSVLASMICIGVVYVAVVIFSRRAVDPVVKASERQKQFITDASHELKTPITVIATCLRLLEMDGDPKWIKKAEAQNEKLRELVSSLVTLSRMDEEKPPQSYEPFPISDAVTETVESFEELARASGHELKMDIEPEITFSGDEYAVRQLVSILMDNAVKYASEGSDIIFKLEKTRKGIRLCESNLCKDLPETELPKLFDRFYRADRARSTGNKENSGGFGIGLSIARRIAEGHKGTIEAKLESGRIVFTVNLAEFRQVGRGSALKVRDDS